MWVYPGSSCPDRPSLKELSVVQVEARIRKVLDSAATPSPGTGPDPIRRGVASVRLSTLESIATDFMILSFHYAHDLVQGLVCGRNESRGTDLPMDASGQEARQASNGVTRACEERERKIGVLPIWWQGNRGRRSLLDLCVAFSLPQCMIPLLAGSPVGKHQ
jgi:hypothetical protein